MERAEHLARLDTGLKVAVGGVLPFLVAVTLVPLRDEMINANVALALMVAVVVAAALGGRLAGAVAAAVSALSYDFFHTRPYHSLRITSRDDVETTVLLLMAGLIVGTVAWRAWRDRASAEAGRSEIRRIHRLAEQVVSGEDPADVILAAEAELTALMDLQGCRFEAPPYETVLLVRLERGATAPETRWSRVTREAYELPDEGAELQVLSRGQPVGRFVLLPKPGNDFSLEQRVVAVALADQVGAVLATSHIETDGRNRRYG
jgi:K+-sensing histidine kinase KdpD